MHRSSILHTPGRTPVVLCLLSFNCRCPNQNHFLMPTSFMSQTGMNTLGLGDRTVQTEPSRALKPCKTQFYHLAKRYKPVINLKRLVWGWHGTLMIIVCFTNFPGDEKYPDTCWCIELFPGNVDSEPVSGLLYFSHWYDLGIKSVSLPLPVLWF